MYERLKRLYKMHQITQKGLEYWVEQGAITPEQMEEIIRSNGDTLDYEEGTAEYYAAQVKNGHMSLSEVPAELRTEVDIRIHIGE